MRAKAADMRTDPVVFAGLMPHAPILVPGVGRERLAQVRRTVWAMARVAAHAVAAGPHTMVVISPHSPRRANAFGIWLTPRLSGSLSQFGAADETVDLPLDRFLAGALEQEAVARGLRTWRITNRPLDHGAFVPLAYLAAAGWTGPTMVVSLTESETAGLDDFGRAISAAAQSLDRNVAVIASGDMSHRLTPDAPGGYDPAGSEFDRSFIGLLRTGAGRELQRIDHDLQEAAGEDVVASTRIALAAAGYISQGHDVLSYEGPFGVGYGVAILFERIAPPSEAGPAGARSPAVLSSRADLPRVARCAIAGRLGRGPAAPMFRAAGELREKHGLFVTVRSDAGELRGCHGSAVPAAPDLVRATWDHAIAAAFHDPRFAPVTADELPHLRITVTILGPLELVRSKAELDPAVYGVLINAADGRRALLLPRIEGLDTVTQQLAAARNKAGIEPDESIEIRRFTGRSFAEPAVPASDAPAE